MIHNPTIIAAVTGGIIDKSTSIVSSGNVNEYRDIKSTIKKLLKTNQFVNVDRGMSLMNYCKRVFGCIDSRIKMPGVTKANRNIRFDYYNVPIRFFLVATMGIALHI